ncbi:MAG: shikimate kinase [Pseudomonadota bacterium]
MQAEVDRVELPPEARHLVLVGMMGCGKSTVARLLGQQLKLGVLDSDDEVTIRAGCSIADFFAHRGEAAFRRLEAAVISDALYDSRQVLALGGGAMEPASTRMLLSTRAITFWLNVPIERLWQRLCADKAQLRPMLQVSNPKARLAELLKRRQANYACADIMVDVDTQTPEAVAALMVKELVTRFGADAGHSVYSR